MNQPPPSPAPPLGGVLETALYVTDLDRSVAFYRDVLGLRPMFSDDRLTAMDVAGRQVLLLFRQGASLEAQKLPGGEIPPHDGSGALHMALAIDAAQLPAWEAQLAAHGVPIISQMRWTRGGKSLYFHDPDGHVIELITPGVWEIY